MSLNKFMGIGNLCADVEVRQVGVYQVGTVTLAMSEKFKQHDGTYAENTEFLKLEMWEKNSIYPYLKKGIQVYVEGKIMTESWDDQNGQKRYTTKCRVQSIQLLGSRPSTEQRVTQAAAQTYAQQRPAQAPQPPQFSQPTFSAPVPPQPRPIPQPPMPQPKQAPEDFGDLPF